MRQRQRLLGALPSCYSNVNMDNFFICENSNNFQLVERSECLGGKYKTNELMTHFRALMTHLVYISVLIYFSYLFTIRLIDECMVAVATLLITFFLAII